MTTSPWAKHRGAQPGPATGRGSGWQDRAGRPRHAGIGTRTDVERHAAELDRHDEDPTEWHGTGTPSGTSSGTSSGTAPDSGTAQRHAHRHGTGTAPARHSGTEDRHDSGAGTVMPSHHQFVVPDDSRAAADSRADEDGVPPQETAGVRHRLFDDLRFVNEDMASLRNLLRFARTATYNMSHLAPVRAANIAFFWIVTAPVLTVAFFLLWAFAVRLHRALTVAVIIGVLGPFANRLLDWLVPDGLDVTTWSATTWSWVGGGLLMFGVATAIALAGERRR
jgi:hypothetical protein